MIKLELFCERNNMSWATNIKALQNQIASLIFNALIWAVKGIAQ